MATKVVNGEHIEMTPEEEAAFEASRTPTLEMTKWQRRNEVIAKWQEMDSPHLVIDKPNAAAYKNGTAARARALAIAVANAPDIAAVHAIDINTGWE